MTTYKPTASARKFHEAGARIKALWGPVGSGKSSAAFWEWVFLCLESPIPLLGLVVRSSYRELMDTSRRTYWNWFGAISEWSENEKKATITLPRAERFGGGVQRHELLFRSIQKPQDTTKIQGLEPAFAFLEECVPSYQTSGVVGQGLPRAVFEIANSRLRQKDAVRYELVCTANPPQPSHWYHEMFTGADAEKLVDMDASVTFQPPFENKPNLPDDYYESILRSMDPEMARRLVMGEIIAAYDGERVFPEAIQGVHVVDKPLDPIKGVPLILGFDWGMTPATIITQITPSGQWRWLRELQSFNKGAEAHLAELRTLMHEFYEGFAYRSWGDPAGAQRSQTDEKTCFQIAAKHGFVVRPGKIDWQSRKEVIKQRLQRMSGPHPALLISRDQCPLAAEGILGGYRYPRSNSGELGTRPIKNQFSHLLDAAQYVATREFSIVPQGMRLAPHEEHAQRSLPFLDPFRPEPRPAPARRGSWMSNPAF